MTALAERTWTSTSGAPESKTNELHTIKLKNKSQIADYSRGTIHALKNTFQRC